MPVGVLITAAGVPGPSVVSLTDTAQLVSDLSYGQADPVVVTEYLTRVIEDLGRFPWLTNASLIPTVSGTSEYQLSNTQVKLLAVFFDNKQLGRLTVREAEMLDSQWRDRSGFPFAYVVEDEPQKTFRLYPNPDLSAKSFVFTSGQPFGVDFPYYSVVIFHTETRIVIPAWLQLPIALEVFAREFERESNHRDIQLAELAHQLAGLLFNMVA